MKINNKLLKMTTPILMLVGIASATIVGIIFLLSFTGQFTYSSMPEDFTIDDAYPGDVITYSKIGDTVFIEAPIYANKQNVLYQDVIKITALRTGTLGLTNAYRTANGITKCEMRFYDFQNGTSGYNWFELGTTPGGVYIGQFNKSQVFILQMRISTGANTSTGEVITFDMKMD